MNNPYAIPGPNHISLKCRQNALMKVLLGHPLPKVRKKEMVPRKPYDLAEARLRVEVVKYFKKHKIYYKRLESSLTGKAACGIPDFLMFTPVYGMNFYPRPQMIWLELKAKTGLRPEQEVFKNHCDIAGISYRIVQSIEDLKALMPARSSK